MRVSRPVARILNTANLLGPALLFVACALLAMSAWGDWSQEEKNQLLRMAGICVGMALLIRVFWGISIAVIRRRKQSEERDT